MRPDLSSEYSQPPGYWTKSFVWQVSIALIVTVAIVCLLFADRLVDWKLIAFGVIVPILFFSLLNFFIRLCRNWSSSRITRLLFLASVLLRITSVFVLYYFYSGTTGEPFEFNAVDSKFYHETAIVVARHLNAGNFQFNTYLSHMGFSDRGFNIYLGILYYLFGPSILVSRCITSVFGALSVVFIYKATEKLHNRNSALIAGLSAMLLPNFLLYSGTHLKETLLVFLVTAFLFIAQKIVLEPRRLVINVLLALVAVLLLFMFRTVLAGIALAAVVGFLLLYRRGKQSKIADIGALVLIAAGFVYAGFNSEIGVELSQYIEKAGTSQQENLQFRAERDGGNKLALLAGAPLFLSIILIAPFPSFVYVAQQDMLWMFIGANLIRNCYAIFTIAGLIYCLRHDWRQSSLFVNFLAGYLLVLANSGFAISERFHMPVVPLLLMFAAIGVTTWKQAHRFFPFYLFAVCILVIVWNYLKLAGRA
jgi:4-amino-4-deoxy-L-arabinose transferase-like glycosyltransferase